ncbi:uncharacterized protein LOC115696560 [Cannabis sativa]|uniref:uncharacterized protein LOC115696560 n=1 Tax=Cannabis sativa TaxID=3483 RepID=UPI0011DF90DD|nr:uncharacterized protein LOC115696560 [Cannabis sativa]
MKIPSCNCQGLARDSANQALMAWVRKYKPECIFLMETKRQSSHMEMIVRRLGYCCSSIVSARGLASGFCLLWNQEIKLKVIHFDNNIFEVEVQDPQSLNFWRLFATYGTPYGNKKANLWAYLVDKVLSCKSPWLVVGDLNCVLNDEEKMGGRAVTSKDTMWLKDFLYYSGGIDLRFNGCKYTWQNKRFQGDLIRERLDRGIGSSEWIAYFPDVRVRNFPISISDHAPIILDTKMHSRRGRIPFRFYDAWTVESSCRDVIRKIWGPSTFEATKEMLRNLIKPEEIFRGGKIKALVIWIKLYACWNRDLIGFNRKKYRMT